MEEKEAMFKLPPLDWRSVGSQSWGALMAAGRFIGRTVMGIFRSVFGAAVLAGALVGPGAYYMTQQNEVVRAKVTGKVQADANTKYPGLKYFIHTDNAGKLDTFSLRNARQLKENCIYDFNLKGARFQAWPPSYSRSIVGVTRVNCK